MRNATRAFLLGPLLKGVSRSFYLTLNVLPAGMRDPIGLAYLLARAADTIADTTLIAPARRLELLLALRGRIAGENAPGGDAAGGDAGGGDSLLRRIAAEVAGEQAQLDEKVLLESLGPALDVLAQLSAADRDAVREITATLMSGMEFDLRTFPDETSGRIVALAEPAELDRYTYLVAGCVGEFWTRMTYAHMPGTLKGDPATAMRRGVRFGQALQMTNVLRDCAKDLRIGRCYLPATMLERHGLTPEALLAPEASRRAQPLLFELLRLTLGQYRDAVDYTLALPRTAVRLRLACLWPVLIGLATLVLLADNDAWLDPAKVSKVTRGEVYRIVGLSTSVVMSDRLLRAWMERLIGRIEGRIGG